MGTVEESVNKCQKNYECYFISKSNEYFVVNFKRNVTFLRYNQKYLIDESNKDVTSWLKIDKNIWRFKSVEMLN